MDTFIAIDYETANSNYLSACALGITFVERGVVLESLQTYIKPPEDFSSFDPLIYRFIKYNQVKLKMLHHLTRFGTSSKSFIRKIMFHLLVIIRDLISELLKHF